MFNVSCYYVYSNFNCSLSVLVIKIMMMMMMIYFIRIPYVSAIGLMCYIS